MRRPRSLATCLPIAFIAGIALNTAAATDLLSVYEQARESDPVFQQAIADRNAVEESLPQARAALRPEVSLNTTASFIDAQSNLTGTEVSDDYQQLSYGVTLTQPIYRYATASAVDQADARVAQARARYAAAEQALALRVAERYFAVLDARESLEAAQASLEAINRQLEQAEQRFAVGVIPRTDVEEARAQADLAEAERLQAEDTLENEREALRELIGRSPATLAVVREGISLEPPKPADPDTWRERARTGNSELTAARFAAEAAMSNIEVERGDRRPTVDLVAGFDGIEQYDRLGSDRDSDELSASLQLNLPLYQGGGTSASIRQAQFRYTEAREALEEIRRRVSSDAANAYRGVLTALRRVEALDQARTSTQAALDATRAGFEVGTRTIVDVLDAERERFNAERDFQQARHAYLLNTLELKAAAGALALADLEQIDALLTEAP
jgi:outer membrane protein